MKLLIGDKFPEIRVDTTKGEMNLPGDFSGKWFVFFSHPADFTPVCTSEFVSFRKRLEEFSGLNTELIGLSVDSIDKHREWIKWIQNNLHIGITFPIIDDSDRKISYELGMLREDSQDTRTARSVVIVDDQGIIRLILEYPKEIGRNIDEILRALTAFSVFEEKKKMTPANWPCNELIGDKVFVKPDPSLSDEEAKEKGITKLSDWFMYTELNDDGEEEKED